MTTMTTLIISTLILSGAMFILSPIEDYFNRENADWTNQGRALVTFLYIALNGVILACLIAANFDVTLVALASGIRFFQIREKF